MSEQADQRTIYYRGKDIETLDRAELLNACRAIMRLLKEEQRWSRQKSETFEYLRRAARQ